MKQYHIFGDIHGHAKLLVKALKTLGYKNKDGVYRNPNFKTIFVGDIINRGRQVKRVIDIVRAMVDAGQAEMVLGNHELNFIAFHTKNDKGKYLRAHNAKNVSRVRPTNRNFLFRDELEDFIQWLRKRPLYLEKKNFRVIHACWHQASINYLEQHYPTKKIKRKLLVACGNKSSEEYIALFSLLNGPELYMKSGEPSRVVKAKWWLNPEGKTIDQLAVKHQDEFPQLFPPDYYLDNFPGYKKKEKPLFIGHYALLDEPKLLKPNLCCLDFGVIQKNRLTVYTYKGEAELKNSHLSVFHK